MNCYFLFSHEHNTMGGLVNIIYFKGLVEYTVHQAIYIEHYMFNMRCPTHIFIGFDQRAASCTHIDIDLLVISIVNVHAGSNTLTKQNLDS